MVTPLGTVLSTDEKAAVQTDLKLIGSTIESLVIEFNQEKFKQLLSSGSVSLKSMRKYRKVSNETRSLASSEASKKKAFLEANRTPSVRHTIQPLSLSRFTQPPLKPTWLAMKSLMRLANFVLRLKANIIAEIILANKPLLRLSKLELTTFVVGKALHQVTKT